MNSNDFCALLHAAALHAASKCDDATSCELSLTADGFVIEVVVRDGPDVRHHCKTVPFENVYYARLRESITLERHGLSLPAQIDACVQAARELADA